MEDRTRRPTVRCAANWPLSGHYLMPAPVLLAEPILLAFGLFVLPRHGHVLAGTVP